MAAIIDRVRVRVTDEEAGDALVAELVQTVGDRVLLRINAAAIPAPLESIVVDATVKMVRRLYYEGISAENVASLSTTFVDDILAEYDQELSTYTAASGTATGKVVHFL